MGPLLLVVGLAAVAISDVVLALPNAVFKDGVVWLLVRNISSLIVYIVVFDIFMLPLALTARPKPDADVRIIALYMALTAGGIIAVSLMNIVSFTPIQAATYITNAVRTDKVSII